MYLFFFFFFMKNILYDSLRKNFLEPPLRTALSNLHLQVFKILYYADYSEDSNTPHVTLLRASDLRSFPQIIRSQFQNCKFVSVSILLIVVHIKEEGPNICFRLIILHRIALSDNLQVSRFILC